VTIDATSGVNVATDVSDFRRSGVTIGGKPSSDRLSTGQKPGHSLFRCHR
jgi:hypothetical protein